MLLCPDCGSFVVHSGGCNHCPSCGWSSCDFLTLMFTRIMNVMGVEV